MCYDYVLSSYDRAHQEPTVFQNIGQVVDLALPNPTSKPKGVDFQRMKKIEDQAIKAVPRVYSIHRCRRSPQIASNPAMQ